MRYLAARASSSDEHWNADCDAVLFRVEGEEDISSLIELVELGQRLKEDYTSLGELAFWSGAEFVSLHDGFDEDGWDAEAAEAALEGNGYAILDIEVPEEAKQRTERYAVVVYVDFGGVSFRANPKHFSVTVESELLSLKALRRLLEQVRHADGTSIGVDASDAETEEPCDECQATPPIVAGGSIANRHHAPSCSLYDAREP